MNFATLFASSFDKPAAIGRIGPCSRMSTICACENLARSARDGVPGWRDMWHAAQRAWTAFVSATESFSQRNINCSIAESLERVAEVAAMARAHGIRVRGYVSCVLGCPYEGDVPAAAVAGVAASLSALGCHEISLGDTIGTGTAQSAYDMVEVVGQQVPIDRLAIHFHDTYGQALANVLACLDAGVSVVDSAIGGLGGCPYAQGASGNLATEDLLYLLDGLGVESGVAMDRLLDAVDFVTNELGIEAHSKVFAAKRRIRAGREDVGQ